MFTKEFLRAQNTKLEEEIRKLKKQLPLSTYKVIDSSEGEVTIKAHGYSSDGNNKYNFWVHPWDNVADFLNPISIKKL